MCSVRNEENIAVFLSLILYRCVHDTLLCHVGNWRYFQLYLVLAIGQQLRKGATGVCHHTSGLLASAVLSCLSVSLCTTASHLFCVLLLHPGVRIEIIRAFSAKINSSGMWHHVVWYTFTCVVEECLTFISQNWRWFTFVHVYCKD